MSDRKFLGALGAALLLAAAACSEQVTSSLGCPELCTDQSAALRDTILPGAVVLDSTFLGFPLRGETRELSLVARGDTADVRIVARFDTLPQRYLPKTAQSDSLIKMVDSATLIFRIDTNAAKPRVPLTIEAFDVDTTAADTLPQALVPLFRDDRRIGSKTYQPSDLKDTVRLPLDSAVLRKKITDGRRLRIGLRLSASQSATLRVSATAFAPRVRFRISADTTLAPDTVFLRSLTPVSDAATAASLQIFPVVASGALPPPPTDRLAVGGVGGARVFLQFNIPAIVLDSVQVVRASLQLAQVPSRSAGGAKDTLTLLTQPVLAAPTVTDIFTASQFLAPVGLIRVDTLRLIPEASGKRSVEIVNVVNAWRIAGSTNTLRALVLRAAEEGSSPGELNFASRRGFTATVPRLRLTYVPRRGFGIP